MQGHKSKLVVIEPAFAPSKVPPPPAGLAAEARREWKRVAPILYGQQLLGDDVMATFEAYCSAVGAMRQYAALMDAEGHIVETHVGKRSHPAFAMCVAVLREVRLYAAELALTPHRRGIRHRVKPDVVSTLWSGNEDLLA